MSEKAPNLNNAKLHVQATEFIDKYRNDGDVWDIGADLHSNKQFENGSAEVYTEGGGSIIENGRITASNDGVSAKINTRGRVGRTGEGTIEASSVQDTESGANVAYDSYAKTYSGLSSPETSRASVARTSESGQSYRHEFTPKNAQKAAHLITRLAAKQINRNIGNIENPVDKKAA